VSGDNRPGPELCAFCPKLCRHVCPVATAEGSEAATPTWKGVLLQDHAEGRRPLAGAVADAVYRCTDCGHQREACLHGVDGPRLYGPVREAAMREGVAPARVRSFAERCRSLGNPFASDLDARLAGIVQRGADGGEPCAPLLPAGAAAELALVPGCAAVARWPEAVRAAVFVLSRVHGGPVPVSAAGAGCCGMPLRSAGDVEGYRTQAGPLLEALAGVDTVIALDPGCVRALSEFAREAGLGPAPRVVHVTEHLAEHLDRVRAAVRRPLGDEVAYHDPCHLGRHGGVFDAPRALLAVACGGRPPTELVEHGARASCSGAGGVYRKVWPAYARRIAWRRLTQHAATGAELLATACPSAARHLGRERPRGRVVTVVELLARAMGSETTAG
jgi:Fe-S oxidoreductase